MPTSTPTPQPSDLLGLLAEPDRLKVVAALTLGAGTTGEVAEATGLTQRAATKALGRLAAGGLVESGPRGVGHHLRAEVFKEAARAVAPTAPVENHGASDPADAAVLRHFLKGGRLQSIPAAKSKRLVVLDHLAKLFEPGIRYPEREVDAALRSFHEDYASLRRYLVDEGFLQREAGVYWRTGGTFVV